MAVLPATFVKGFLATAVVTISAGQAHALAMTCTPFGYNGFSGTVVVAEDSNREPQTPGAKAATITATLSLSHIDRSPGHSTDPVRNSFSGELNGEVQTLPAGQFTVKESTFISGHNDADEVKAGLKILLGLGRKNATFTYKGLVFEALCTSN